MLALAKETKHLVYRQIAEALVADIGAMSDTRNTHKDERFGDVFFGYGPLQKIARSEVLSSDEILRFGKAIKAISSLNNDKAVRLSNFDSLLTKDVDFGQAMAFLLQGI